MMTDVDLPQHYKVLFSYCQYGTSLAEEGKGRILYLNERIFSFATCRVGGVISARRFLSSSSRFLNKRTFELLSHVAYLVVTAP